MQLLKSMWMSKQSHRTFACFASLIAVHAFLQLLALLDVCSWYMVGCKCSFPYPLQHPCHFMVNHLLPCKCSHLRWRCRWLSGWSNIPSVSGGTIASCIFWSLIGMRIEILSSCLCYCHAQPRGSIEESKLHHFSGRNHFTWTCQT